MSDLIEIHADLTSIQGPTLDQYLGPWLMMEERFMQQLQMIQSINLTEHIKQNAETAKNEHTDKPFNVVRGNIALINIEGTMTKRGSSFGAGGTIRTRRQVRAARNDADIAGVFLRIDSPGGTSAGTADLADDVFDLTKEKPVMTFFEDTGASAAFFVGSQATVTRSNASAIIGSIGTLLVVLDMSEMAKNQGIKVHVISTGDFKGAGVPGSEVTEEQLAHFQTVINSGNEIFLEAVVRGTSLSMKQVRQLADGRVHLAAEAAELGLIDGVSTMDEALDELVSLSSTRRTVTMSETIAPVAAQLSELQAAFPEASAEFFVNQLGKGATVEGAQRDYNAQLQAELAAANQGIADAKQETVTAQAATEEAKKEVEAAKQRMPGNPSDSAASFGDGETVVYENATEKWKELIKQEMDPAQGGRDKKSAVVKVDLNNPGLREQFLAEHKPKPGLVSQPPR